MNTLLKHTLFASLLLTGHLTFAGAAEESQAPQPLGTLTAVSDDNANSELRQKIDAFFSQHKLTPSPSNTMDCLRKEALVKNLLKETESDVDEILTSAETVIQHCELTETIRIIDTLREMPQRAPICMYAAMLIKGTEKPPFGSTRDLLIIIEKIIQNNNEDLLPYIAQIAEKCTSLENKNGLLETLEPFLSVTSADQREEMVGHVINSIKKDLTFPPLNVITDLYSVISRINPEDRVHLLDCANTLMSGRITDCDAKVPIITALKDFEPDARKLLLSHAAPFMEGGIAGRFKPTIIDAVYKVLNGPPSNVLDLAKSLMPKSLQLASVRAQLIETLNEVPTDQRTDVCEHAQPLIEAYQHQESDESNIGIPQLIKAISEVEPAQRTDVCAHALKIMGGQTPALYKAEAIGVIKNILPAERNTVLGAAQPFLTFLTPETALAAKPKIIKVVHELDPTARKNLLPIVETFLTEIDDSKENVLFKHTLIKDIVQALGTASVGDRNTILQVAAPFIQSNTLSGSSKLEVFRMMIHTPNLQNAQEICDATHQFITPTMPEHDITRIMSDFCRFKQRNPNINIPEHAQRVHDALNRDIQGGELMEGQVLSRILELIENPDAPLFAQNLEVTGQEALTAERQPIYNFYRSVSGHSLMQAGLTEATIPFADVIARVKATIEGALGTEDMPPQQQFRYQTMLQGLEYMATRRGTFALDALPTIQEVARQLHHVLMHQPKPDLMEPLIINHWGDLRQAFPTAAKFDSAGTFLASREGQQFKQNLRDVLNGEKDTLGDTRLDRNMLKWLKRFAQEATAEPSDMERLAPLTEALFTIMRGHVAPGQMLNPDVPHNTACTDGVYLGLLRAFQEVPELAKGQSIQDVAVVGCAAP